MLGHHLAQAPKAYEVKEGAAQNVDITWAHGIIEVDLEVSQNGGTPIAGWFLMENPTKVDELTVPPISGNLHL